MDARITDAILIVTHLRSNARGSGEKASDSLKEFCAEGVDFLRKYDIMIVKCPKWNRIEV
jgi:hypothetical protein